MPGTAGMVALLPGLTVPNAPAFMVTSATVPVPLKEAELAAAPLKITLLRSAAGATVMVPPCREETLWKESVPIWPAAAPRKATTKLLALKGTMAISAAATAAEKPKAFSSRLIRAFRILPSVPTGPSVPV